MTENNPNPDGKNFNWRPRFNEEPPVMDVAADARPALAQLQHFSLLAVSMHATREEAEDIIDALQLCERRHGYGKVGPILAKVTAAIENAVTLTGLSITTLGIQRQLANAGLFVGALVEQMAEVDSSTRRFPLSEYQQRANSPRPEFEDCLMGASIAKRFGYLHEDRPQAALPFSALVASFRMKLGARGVLMVEEIVKKSVSLWKSKIEIAALAEQTKTTLPVAWTLF